LWTRLEGDDLKLTTGDPVHFDDTDSLRWRLGMRYYVRPNTGGRFYFGTAYEYEHDAATKSTSHGYKVKAPSLDGGTAIGEFGYVYHKYMSPFSADFNIAGYAGRRQGFSTRLDLDWEF